MYIEKLEKTEETCNTPEECDWRAYENCEGDPGVINGTRSWIEYHCRSCGAVVQDRPASYKPPHNDY